MDDWMRDLAKKGFEALSQGLTNWMGDKWKIRRQESFHVGRYNDNSNTDENRMWRMEKFGRLAVD
jgi:hypothetical protein